MSHFTFRITDSCSEILEAWERVPAPGRGHLATHDEFSFSFDLSGMWETGDEFRSVEGFILLET